MSDIDLGTTGRLDEAKRPAELCSSDLLACPFCGGQATMGETPDGGRYVQCNECLTSSRLIYPDKIDPKPLLLEAWNTRHTPPTTEKRCRHGRLSDEVCWWCEEEGQANSDYPTAG